MHCPSILQMQMQSPVPLLNLLGLLLRRRAPRQELRSRSNVHAASSFISASEFTQPTRKQQSGCSASYDAAFTVCKSHAGKVKLSSAGKLGWKAPHALTVNTILRERLACDVCISSKLLAMLLQDQATALGNSVQDLQQQLKDLQLPDQIQQELVPIQDSVRKTTHDLNRSAVMHSSV